MAHELQTLITKLFPRARGIRLTDITIEDEAVRLQLTATAPTAACPRGAVSSSSIHRRDQRHLTDLPWRTHAVQLQLTVRKFFCRNPSFGAGVVYSAQEEATMPLLYTIGEILVAVGEFLKLSAHYMP